MEADRGCGQGCLFCSDLAPSLLQPFTHRLQLLHSIFTHVHPPGLLHLHVAQVLGGDLTDIAVSTGFCNFMSEFWREMLF